MFMVQKTEKHCSIQELINTANFQMECDYGIYKRTAIKKEILLHDDRYIPGGAKSIGYEFYRNGIPESAEEGLAGDFEEQIAPVLMEKYTTEGKSL